VLIDRRLGGIVPYQMIFPHCGYRETGNGGMLDPEINVGRPTPNSLTRVRLDLFPATSGSVFVRDPHVSHRSAPPGGLAVTMADGFGCGDSDSSTSSCSHRRSIPT
jgi:hypothetical protein